jgi:hypothetical protein
VGPGKFASSAHLALTWFSQMKQLLQELVVILNLGDSHLIQLKKTNKIFQSQVMYSKQKLFIIYQKRFEIRVGRWISRLLFHELSKEYFF